MYRLSGFVPTSRKYCGLKNPPPDPASRRLNKHGFPFLGGFPCLFSFAEYPVTSGLREAGGIFSFLLAFSYVRVIPLDQGLLLSGAERMVSDPFGRLNLFQ